MVVICICLLLFGKYTVVFIDLLPLSCSSLAYRRLSGFANGSPARGSPGTAWMNSLLCNLSKSVLLSYSLCLVLYFYPIAVPGLYPHTGTKSPYSMLSGSEILPTLIWNFCLRLPDWWGICSTCLSDTGSDGNLVSWRLLILAASCR